jgi:rare lipoprotein A (peptidoglycan hydrolase)
MPLPRNLPHPSALATSCVAASLALMLGLPTVVSPAVAAPAASAAAKAASVRTKQAEAARIRTQLDAQRQKLATGIARAARVSAELSRTRKAEAAEARRLAKLALALAKRQRILNAFAVRAYQYGEADVLATVVGAISVDDFLNRLRFVELLGASHAQTIAWVKEARGQSIRLEASLRSRSARLAVVKAEADRARASVQSQMSSQQQALDSLSSDVKALLAQQERASHPADPGRGGGGAPIGGPTGGGDWMSMSSLAPGARATVEGRSGAYVIPAGVPGAYTPDGVSWSAQASQYSVADNGTGTSSGRPLNDGELTCAHKTLPMGTLIAVTHGGNRVIVVVTDRGPFSPPGRDIDLSVASARELGIDGTGQVHEEIVTPVK